MANKLELVPTNSRYAKLCHTALKGFTKSERNFVRISGKPSTTHSVVVARVDDLPTGMEGQHLIFTGDMQAALVGLCINQWKKRPDRVHIVAHEKEPSQATIERLVSGYLAPDNTPIIDALWCGDDFLIVSHLLEPMRVQRHQLEKWLGTDQEKHAQFEIDSDGSFVHWPHADAHFGWKQLSYLIDPAAAVAADRRSAEFQVEYGGALRRVRESRGLRQADLGLNERHVRRIEQGLQFPTAKALGVMAQGHGLTTEDYLDLVAKSLN
jgi:hypothetical protein